MLFCAMKPDLKRLFFVSITSPNHHSPKGV
jgi:hypothetical protein